MIVQNFKKETKLIDIFQACGRKKTIKAFSENNLRQIFKPSIYYETKIQSNTAKAKPANNKLFSNIMEEIELF